MIGGVELNPGPDTVDVMEKIRASLREVLERQDGHSSLLQELLGFRERVEGLELRVASLEKENSSLSRKIDYLENQSRRNNLLVFGLEELRGETWADSERLVHDVAEQVGVKLDEYDVERAHRVGRRPGKRPIVVKLASFKKRDELLHGAAQKLRDAPIRVAEDFSAPVRHTRQLLSHYLQDARKKGHRASLRFDKLIVDGRHYTLAELQEASGPCPRVQATPPTERPPAELSHPADVSSVRHPRPRPLGTATASAAAVHAPPQISSPGPSTTPPPPAPDRRVTRRNAGDLWPGQWVAGAVGRGGKRGDNGKSSNR